jgi:hypothetical protein
MDRLIGWVQVAFAVFQQQGNDGTLLGHGCGLQCDVLFSTTVRFYTREIGIWCRVSLHLILRKFNILCKNKCFRHWHAFCSIVIGFQQSMIWSKEI